jgi:hypothetical protein
MTNPKISIRSFRLGKQYADYLKYLETSVYRELLPCSVDAFDFSDFSSYTDDVRQRYTSMHKLSAQESMPSALEEYKAGKRPTEPWG